MIVLLRFVVIKVREFAIPLISCLVVNRFVLKRDILIVLCASFIVTAPSSSLTGVDILSSLLSIDSSKITSDIIAVFHSAVESGYNEVKQSIASNTQLLKQLTGFAHHFSGAGVRAKSLMILSRLRDSVSLRHD